MRYRRRIYYNEAQKRVMWDRWQQGESLHDIARLFNRGHSSIRRIIANTGGIRPPDRKRSRLALTLSEREEISRGIVGGLSMRAMARQLNRSPSTISREIKRNGGIDHYRASEAEHATWDRAQRPKACKLANNAFLCRTIAAKLKIHWSPQQIAGWLKRTYPGEDDKTVSHKTIYRSLFIQARGVLKKELLQYLKTQRTLRRSRRASSTWVVRTAARTIGLGFSSVCLHRPSRCDLVGEFGDLFREPSRRDSASLASGSSSVYLLT